MKIIRQSADKFDARGVCPHCNYPSYFQMVTNLQTRLLGITRYMRCVAECQNCQHAILLVGRGSGDTFQYSSHYPAGKPNDILPDEIPQRIGEDFKEALRCQFVDAHRATATMCRRALQASCQELGADGDRLIKQIDDLATKGKITAALTEMAHTVRLTGNIGAHPDKDGLEDVSPEDASDLIDFSRAFYEHVYVLPSKLLKMKERHNSPDASSTE